jgi:hypothetical protein
MAQGGPVNTCTFCKQDTEITCQFSGQADYCHRMKKVEDGALAAVADAVAPAVLFTPGPLQPPAPPWPTKPAPKPAPAPFTNQVGGDHYSSMAIQPTIYCELNGLGASESNVIKYVSRWKNKNGIQDLEKARDVLDKKIALEKARTDVMEALSALFKTI